MAKFLSYRPFQQHVEYGIVHRNLQSGNASATHDHPRPSLELEDEQMFRLGEFVDDPYNKFLTVKIPKARRVYDKFHACF
jgi:hypothetical protein